VVCENWVLTEQYVPKREEMRKGLKNCIRRNYMICALHKVFFLSDQLKDDKMGRTCSPCQAKRMCKFFCPEQFLGRDHFRDKGMDETTITEWI